MLNIQNLTKKYKEKLIFKDLNIQFNSREISYISGENGSGKSTLFKCIMGMENYTGSIWYNDKNLNSLDIGSRSKAGISLLTQEMCLLTAETVNTNLNIVSELKISHYEGRKEKLKEVVLEFNLASILSKKVNKLSGGEKKRVQAALLFINEIKQGLYLMDEPFSELDDLTSNTLWKKIKYLQQNDNIVVITSHTHLNKMSNISKSLIIEDYNINQI